MQQQEIAVSEAPVVPFVKELRDERAKRAYYHTRNTLEAAGQLTLQKFIELAWHAVEPSREYVHGWAIDAICEHLMAVHKGQILRLAIAIPPGMSKSLTTSVFFPAYLWGPAGEPSKRILGFSHETGLSRRDAMKCRRLMQSGWYQNLWSSVFKLSDDQNAKDRYENDQTGFRVSDYVGGGTGERGDLLIIDDPHRVQDPESEAKRQTALLWLHETLPTRLNDPEKTGIVIIHHRLHEQDMIGEVMACGLGYELLQLPMEFEKARRCRTSIGWIDPREEEGELLFPARFPRDVVERDKKAMGGNESYAVASQFQQRPAPRGGLMFKRHWFELVDVPPADCYWVRHWDLAATLGAGAYTAGVLMGRSRSSKVFYIKDVKRVQLEGDGVKKLILQTAAIDLMELGKKNYAIRLPQDPGQAGKPVWEEEPVLCGDGSLKKLAFIKVGDFVIGKSGKPALVEAVHLQGELPTLTITTDSGRQVTVALDHPLLTPDGWRNAEDLKINDVLALRSKPQIEIDCTRTAAEFRLAGYFIGDGAVGRPAKAGPNGSCHAAFCCWDEVEMQDFRYCISSLGGEVRNLKRVGTYNTVGMQDWLRKTGLAGQISYTKHVPQWVFTASPSLIAEFLGAYFACDGTLAKRGDEVLFYSVSKELLEGVQHLLLRLGINSTLRQKKGKYREQRHLSWLLNMKQRDDAVGRFMRRVPVHHSKKGASLAQIEVLSRNRRFDEEFLPDVIVSIEPAGRRFCRCLTVANDASFLVRDIVVHNTQARDFINLLAGYDVKAELETGDKETRARPLAAQCEAGNVKLIKGSYVNDFLNELTTFPQSKYKDQTDAASGAFASLILNPKVQLVVGAVAGLY